jgi:hypothetical protein
MFTLIPALFHKSTFANGKLPRLTPIRNLTVLRRIAIVSLPIGKKLKPSMQDIPAFGQTWGQTWPHLVKTFGSTLTVFGTA